MSVPFKNVRMKVWKVEKNDKFTKVQVSTSRKDKNNDTWVNSAWFGTLLGKAHGAANNLKEKDTIYATGSLEMKEYEKDGKKTYTPNMIIFEWAFEKDEVEEKDPFDDN